MLEDLRAELRSMASPERARTVAGYFKTGPGQYGEGDRFAGLALPQMRGLRRKYRDLSIEDTEALLHSPIHEERLLALLILVQRFNKADAATRQRIFDLYLDNTAWINNWDLVDASAEHIVGAYLADKSKEILFRLATSPLVWDRRIAMLATFHGIKAGDPTLALQIAEALLSDKHDLIHKAVGWMLREVEKRCGRYHLTSFLDQHASTMPRTALRYAIEHLSAEERQHYLTLKQRAYG